LHQEEVNIAEGIGSLKYVLPSPYGVVDSDGSYRSPYETANWGKDNFVSFSRSLTQIDESLFMNSEEYRQAFIRGMFEALGPQLEKKFVQALQLEPTRWQCICIQYPYSQNITTDLESLKYAFRSTLTGFQHVDLPYYFIPRHEDCSEFLLSLVSSYAQKLGYKDVSLLASEELINGMSMSYGRLKSGNNNISFGSRIYNNSKIDNGCVKVSQTNARQNDDKLASWTQGVVLSPTAYTDKGDYYELLCTINNLQAYRPSTLYIPTSVPLIFNATRYSPGTSIDGPVTHDSTGFRFSLYLKEAISITGFNTMTSIPLKINKSAFGFVNSSRFPNIESTFLKIDDLINTASFINSVIMTPWIPGDFIQAMQGNKILTSASAVLHKSYMYPKEAVHGFYLRQKAFGGGVDSSQEKLPHSDIPIMLNAQGDASKGTNTYQAICGMAFGVTPELGGVLLTAQPYVS